jgi:quinohemoprotein ethanol dehydrogenase
VARKIAWSHEEKAPFNGGVLATAGGLVFAGNLERQLNAFDAKTGKKLWSFDAQTGIMAPPITYRLDGEQYVAVMAGWGGGWPLTGGVMALKAGNATGTNRLLVFKLGGTAKLPSFAQKAQLPFPKLASAPAAPGTIAAGDKLYGRFCLRCHGSGAVSAGAYPDLRRSNLIDDLQHYHMATGGALATEGMPDFSGMMSRTEEEAIRAYLIHRSREDAKECR